ncbi:MAG: glycoside hydrolase family 15 protein [Alphaproteobacteria bacterium]|nr:glycoside hydrolase family 15 protein [Alphaproteobacteria bacterium]
MSDRQPRTEDYALIGDTYTAALVGRDGSIDWLCVPRFDSPACFARLLGTEENGFWRIAPAAKVRATRRRYRDETLILETDFETEGGAVRIIDFMPFGAGERVEIIRIVRGLHGSVGMAMRLALRFDYGRIVPWVRARPYGLHAVAGPDAMSLETPVALRGEDFTTVAHFTVLAGQEIPFILRWRRSHKPERSGREPRSLLDETAERWRQWSARCSYEGEWRDAVLRSLITLKALTYRPTGGIVAAPTASLPERLGGARNWDYRFCWIRDATLTLLSLASCGFTEEAKAWREWLLRAAAGKPEELQIMYGLAGERRLEEYELPWLRGFAGSKPVRVGNAAHAQFQLDVFGELMDALQVARKHGLELDNEAWRVQTQLLDFLEGAWQRPDHGIWEIRGPKQHFTHSKVMAWVGLDRSIAAVESFGFKGPLERWRALRAEIHADVCRHGFSTQKNAFVQYYGGKDLDAALLMLPLVGFLPVSDLRIEGTVAAIQRELVYDGLVLRYLTHTGVDGLEPGEGAFLACTFWLVDNLTLLGRDDEARALFERLLSLRNDVGLLAEEYDPRARRQLGNFPQAFSHIGIINSAQNLVLAKGPAKQRLQHSGRGAARAPA